ncbi:type 1 glutamine amidotransferase domain-containing protein [Nocardia sp. NPDC005978]|uniref:type 1 glutamine amidotransferase domain-containing protein n=1 Tax=Nocardia sp. NPDC005978 TaxID=3156725 RepID=UPI00339E4BAF
MSDELDGMRVLIATSNTGVEHDELVVPRDRLRERGAQVTHGAIERAPVRTFRHDLEPDEVVQPDTALAEIDPAAFDVLVVPGGTVNADKLRVDPSAQGLVRAFVEAGSPIAAICHGPWLLAETDIAKGKTLTSYPSLRTDLVNAGADWVDEAVARDPREGWTLITSRTPEDLPDFVDAIAAELAAHT